MFLILEDGIKTFELMNKLSWDLIRGIGCWSQSSKQSYQLICDCSWRLIWLNFWKIGSWFLPTSSDRHISSPFKGTYLSFPINVLKQLTHVINKPPSDVWDEILHFFSLLLCVYLFTFLTNNLWKSFFHNL